MSIVSTSTGAKTATSTNGSTYVHSYLYLAIIGIKIRNHRVVFKSNIIAKQNTLGVSKKSARPIRSSLANRYVRPKTLISVEAKKLLIKNLFNYLNDIQ